MTHKIESSRWNPLEKLILAVINVPKLICFDCLIIGPITEFI